MKTKLSSTFLILLISSIVNAQFIGTGSTNQHSVIVKPDGKIYSWGLNSYWQLGNKSSVNTNTPVAAYTGGVLGGKVITQVANGSNHTVALSNDGKIYAWGLNNYGQVGNGTIGVAIEPVLISSNGTLNGKTAIQVAAGLEHTVALATDGTVYAWGNNSNGQLGDGTNNNSNVPVAVYNSGVLSGKNIIQIAAGANHSVALASDGTVYAWGNNTNGQLGNGTNNSSNVPVAVFTSGELNGKLIIKIAAGVNHTVALASDGTVYTWGLNGAGQLGNGNFNDYNVPVAVNTSGVLNGKSISQIAAGGYFTLALSSDNQIYSWGSNGSGQLGNGNNNNSNVPVAVDQSVILSGKIISQIAAGNVHALALTSDGLVATWGNNANGQLGNGNNNNSNVPVAVNQSSMGALPVCLSSFSANITKSGILLKWETASEIDNYGFEIECNTNNNGWETIGFIKGNGTTNIKNTYSFIDKISKIGKLFYRLKQINNDGSFTYSQTIEISNEPKTFTLYQNYPNPFNPTTQITYYLPYNTNVRIKIYDITGRELFTAVNEYQQSGIKTISIDCSNLTSGIYYYQLQAGNYKETKKMVLVK